MLDIVICTEMEQEWTEDEESKIQSEEVGNLSEEDNSGVESEFLENFIYKKLLFQ